LLQGELAATQIRPYRLVGAYEGEGNRYVLRFDVIVDGSHLRAGMGLVAGDAIHNLRAALDHLAWQLAVAGGGANRRTQFPIYDDQATFRGNVDSVLRGVSLNDRATIEMLQPYHLRAPGALEGGHRDLGLNAMIMIVSRLDNVDKHTVLLPTVAVAQVEVPRFTNVLSADVRTPGPWIIVEDGAMFCELNDLVPEDPSRPIVLDSDPQVAIVFGDPTPLSDEAIWSDRSRGAASEADLFAAADAVERVIGLFAGSFDRS
jgi:hypothetical protein